MTERIDLDELDAAEETDEDGPNPGDWFWREEGDPEDAPGDDPEDVPEAVTDVKTAATRDSVSSENDSESSKTGGSASAESADPASDSASDPTSGPVPRVPRANEDKPAGIPMESGGAGARAGADAGGAASTDAAAGAETGADADEEKTESTDNETVTPEASGPHGGGADDMTLAFTYDAATRLADFGRVAADATGWADWLGIVGDVPAHVLNKFQRDRNVDLDFFNGSARGPGERLADIDRHSMFFSERTVVVGIEGEDEEIAERADWEFVPLADAAEKAGWEIAGDSSDEDGDSAGENGDSAGEDSDPVGEGDDSADADDDSPDEDGTSTE